MFQPTLTPPKKKCASSKLPPISPQNIAIFSDSIIAKDSSAIYSPRRFPASPPNTPAPFFNVLACRKKISPGGSGTQVAAMYLPPSGLNFRWRKKIPDTAPKFSGPTEI